eukprot:RCo042911
MYWRIRALWRSLQGLAADERPPPLPSLQRTAFIINPFIVTLPIAEGVGAKIGARIGTARPARGLREAWPPRTITPGVGGGEAEEHEVETGVAITSALFITAEGMITGTRRSGQEGPPFSRLPDAYSLDLFGRCGGFCPWCLGCNYPSLLTFRICAPIVRLALSTLCCYYAVRFS